jgi:hypothetical protein
MRQVSRTSVPCSGDDSPLYAAQELTGKPPQPQQPPAPARSSSNGSSNGASPAPAPSPSRVIADMPASPATPPAADPLAAALLQEHAAPAPGAKSWVPAWFRRGVPAGSNPGAAQPLAQAPRTPVVPSGTAAAAAAAQTHAPTRDLIAEVTLLLAEMPCSACSYMRMMPSTMGSSLVNEEGVAEHSFTGALLHCMLLQLHRALCIMKEALAMTCICMHFDSTARAGQASTGSAVPEQSHHKQYCACMVRSLIRRRAAWARR